MIREKGFAIVASESDNPREPNKLTMLFGPSVSKDSNYKSSLVSSNGFKLFKDKVDAEAAMMERAEDNCKTFRCFRLVYLELQIAETNGDAKALEDHGSYTIAYGKSLRDCTLLGPSNIDGVEILLSHDSWAPFEFTGLSPYKKFYNLMHPSYGTISEIRRQCGPASEITVWLIGVIFDWEVDQGRLF